MKRTSLTTLALRIGALCMVLAVSSACSHDRPPAPPAPPAPAKPVERHVPVVETPKQMETATAYQASLGRGAELYLPPWFAAKKGFYDLIVHFHGEGRWQQANLKTAQLNVAVVSVNLGVGTDPYANAFRSPEAFERLLADTQAEIVKSQRAENPQLRRIALSAWSAGFSSVSKVMTDSVAQRVDAVLLADGFFTFFTDLKKRTVNARGIEKFARFAEAAKRDEKLFAITHTTIPTGPYPSAQECVAKLLDMVGTPKTPSSVTGPRNLHEIYLVDQGSFHVHGFEGTQAADHVRQLHAMGETMYPYLKARWDKQDAEEAARAANNAPAR